MGNPFRQVSPAPGAYRIPASVLNDVPAHSEKPPLFEADKYPVATYKGTLWDFIDGASTTVNANLTLHGVTRPSVREPHSCDA